MSADEELEIPPMNFESIEQLEVPKGRDGKRCRPAAEQSRPQHSGALLEDHSFSIGRGAKVGTHRRGKENGLAEGRRIQRGCERRRGSSQHDLNHRWRITSVVVGVTRDRKSVV